MGTEIRTWQIEKGALKPINSKLKDTGRTEPYDLEAWIGSNPEILSSDISVIGSQVTTKSGPMDLLAIDSSGNLVVIELKRDRLPREVLAQAIDYASDIATWSVEKISEVCTSNTGKTLEEIFEEQFPDIELESINIKTPMPLIPNRIWSGYSGRRRAIFRIADLPGAAISGQSRIK